MRRKHHLGGAGTGAVLAILLLASSPAAGVDPSSTVTVREFAAAPNSQPEGIVAGPDGNVWFTESYGNPPPAGSPAAIGRIRTNGTQLTEFPVPTDASEPHGITVGSDGNLWFTERTGNKVGRITTAGEVTEYRVPTKDSQPDIIVPGPDGNLWFTEKLGNKITRFRPGAGPSERFTEFAIPTPNSEPHEIVVGPDGNLWFTEVAGNKIGRMTLDGVFTEFPIATPDSKPFGMTVGPDDNLWFTECGPGTCRPWVASTTNNIGRLDPDTGAITEFPLPNAGRPFGITTGYDGNLWFTEVEGNRIGVITTAGAVVAEYPVPTAQSFPLEIIRGPDGHLWFTEHGAPANNVARIDIRP